MATASEAREPEAYSDCRNRGLIGLRKRFPHADALLHPIARSLVEVDDAHILGANLQIDLRAPKTAKTLLAARTRAVAMPRRRNSGATARW